MLCFLGHAGDPEEFGGRSRGRRGVGTGVGADALPPRSCSEDAPHAAHAVPLLRQVRSSYCRSIRVEHTERFVIYMNESIFLANTGHVLSSVSTEQKQ